MHKVNSNIIQIARGALIILFAYTATSKLIGHEIFRMQISYYPYIKDYFDPISYAVPVTELTIVSLLIINKTQRSGLLTSAILLFIFTVYLTAMVLTVGHDLPCSCGGVMKYMTWKQHIVFNSFFIALATYAYIIIGREETHKQRAVNTI